MNLYNRSNGGYPPTGHTDNIATIPRQEFRIKDTQFTSSTNRMIRLTSEGLGSPDIVGIRSSEMPFEDRFGAGSPLWLVLSLADLRVRTSVDKMSRELIVPSGAVAVYAPDIVLDVALVTPVELCHVFIKQEVMTEVADDLYGRKLDHIDIQSAVAQPDTSLSRLIDAFHHMFINPEGGSFRSDYIARAIAAQVLAKHAQFVDVPTLPDGGTLLSRRQLQVVREFLEAHLHGDFLFADLAASIGLNRTAFFQRFALTTKQTPNQYLQSLRIERVKTLLKDGDLALVDIASASGFCDQSHMTRFFTRHVGISPARYRKMS